jgi:2-iminobutanoate/2-iminopropanoate deaminase
MSAAVSRREHPSGLSISESVSVSGPGTWIHVSGQIPTGPDGEILGGPMREQAHSCFKSLDLALVNVGSALADVVKITVFITDFSQLPEVNAVRSEFFDGFPASSAVEVSALFGGAELEIEAVAFKPDRATG